MDRRAFIASLMAAGVSPAALAAACSRGGRDSDNGSSGGMGDGMNGGMGEEMPDWMMGGDSMGSGMMRDMRVIHDLLVNHEEIDREVDDIDGGIRATTTSSDGDIAELIRTHVQQMKVRVEEGRAIRQMDPLFAEIFEHYEAISMAVEEVPGGVQVTETSKDDQVELLIRQHAHRAVSEFVDEGMRRAMRATPLPEGYEG